MREGHGMVEIHGLAFGFGAVGVNQNDFRCQPTQQQGVGISSAHIACTYDRNPSM
jgi:hypothetical protein